MQQHEDGVDHEPAQDSGRVNEDRLALRLAAFCVYMQQHQGMVAKSPGYMLERWKSVSGCNTADELITEMVLDERVLFHKWRDAWVKP